MVGIETNYAQSSTLPVSWQKLRRALRGTVDAELIEGLHSWTSLPFEPGEHKTAAVRVITQDGNASEVVIPLDKAGV